jgi:putative membrane protein
MSSRRLHPAAAVAQAAEQLRGLALPIIIAIVLSRGTPTRALVYGLLGVAISLVGGILRWASERWRLDEGGIHHTAGIFTTQQRTIPLERIQGIETVRGPIQRLFGLVEVHVQAAGGGRTAEIVLRAVTPEEADALRERIGTPAALAPAEVARPQRRLGLGGLLLTALTAGRVGVLLPIVAAASQVVDDVAGSDAARALVPHTAGRALLLAAVVILAAWLLSFLGAIVSYAGFTVTRDGDRLRTRRGLLQRTEASIPVARVAGVRIVESVLRQPFGLAEVRLESAGYAREERPARTLFPLVARRDVPALLEELLPEHRLPDVALRRPPARARRRYVLIPLVAAAALDAVAFAVDPLAGLPALALLPAAVVLGLARHRAAGIALHEGIVVVRRRVLGRTTLVAEARRLQSLTRSDTPFTRRAGLASVGVAVSSGAAIGVRHLERGPADALLGRLAALAR